MKISGRRVSLRDEPRAGDDEDLFRWLNMEEWKYYDQPDQPFKAISRAEFEQLLDQRRSRPTNVPETSHGWHIDTLDGRHIGWVNYYNLDEEARCAYAGICLPEEDTWGQGYGSEALGLLVEHLLGEMGVKEVRVATWTGNRRMMACAAKCGFHEIGRMPHRAVFSVRGEPLERVEFSFSKSD